MIVLDVDSVDDTLAIIEKQGGSTLVGRTAVGDNVIGLCDTAGRS
ncbi:hypothetical protein [Amycolatopsis decaplanina]|uniref:Uncharacterized protein n=1 Tax=Amycolatopsis decaplanina DSM 44594 TaxID=1284240 RepID=M2YVR8_9PSEU|nr:hypothetical protein [Amycolatopsis decaplanina]EME52454.1 hypothetical protein H074_33144 [Amycolatopsis decaplanina DSM 44594]